MRQRDMPAKLWTRVLGVFGLPCTYSYHYLGRALKREAGYLDLGSDDPKDNRKLRLQMSSVVLRGRTGKKHTYHVGWLPTDFGISKVYWGLGKLKEVD